MKKAISLIGFGVLTLFAACSAEKTDKGASSIHGSGSFPGAIFTTTEDGSVVNENHYDSCTMVYLNGGPQGGSPRVLPAGDYYFFVTDPSGKTLLSSDALSNRMFTVGDNGEIASHSGSHDTGTDINDGAMTVQLWPFNVTPNPGGEYKAFIVPVDAYEPGSELNQMAHKSDNFKCDRPNEPDAGPPPDSGPPPTDSGQPPTDSGQPPGDAGPPTDSGQPPPVDSGQPPGECEDEECLEQM